MMAFLAILREGFETAVFLLAVFQDSSNPGAAGTGAVLGLVAATALGIAIYHGGVKLKLVINEHFNVFTRLGRLHLHPVRPFGKSCEGEDTKRLPLACHSASRRRDRRLAAGRKQGGLKRGSLAEEEHHCFRSRKDGNGFRGRR